jgi:alanyl-tRNA synthetase
MENKLAEAKNKAAQYIRASRVEKDVESCIKADTAEAELLLKGSRGRGLKLETARSRLWRRGWHAGDYLRDADDSVAAVLAAVSASDGKITFIASCGKGAVAAGIKAGDLIKTVTRLTGGSGGGKPDSAMGGGKDSSRLGEAFAFVKESLNSML